MKFSNFTVPEVEADTGWGANRLFHGTAAENSQYILVGESPGPIVDQAKGFLKQFDLNWREVEADSDFGPMWNYMFNLRRDSEMSCADEFDLARRYSLRAPEWKWYLFQAIHSRVGVRDYPDGWQAMASHYFSKEPNPHVLVLHTPIENEVVPLQYKKFLNGREVRISLPWSDGVFVESVVEIARTTPGGD